ncbi:DUF1214 domain-containing protein [Thalassotalea psychrophila]|uniref:DUF1214 domain-containing protein n=1 Tax=Thalassotalea psychrophila TaxID=3065647 RepID=A0ABY9U5L4_9GAMM|nr:DUF1214 domain-containing protein [Colwelliaceae bacterium SQ149]
MKKCMLTTSLILALSVPSLALANDTTETRIDFGAEITVDAKGFPTKNSIDTVYDEMDYQRAVQAYLWSVPQMAVYGQLKMNHHFGSVKNTDALTQYKDVGIDGMLTPNTIVRYVFNMPNLAETGPLVIEYPGGKTVGVIHDSQMKYVTDVGLITPAGAKPEKLLLIRDNQQLPKGTEEYRIVRVPTNLVFWGFRVLNPEQDTEIHKNLHVYPFAERANPVATEFFSPKDGDETYFMAQPEGMAYWQQLHEYIQLEDVLEVDRYMMSHLKAVGIEKDKPFAPTARQQKILQKAALVGEKMAMVTSFAPRSDESKYRDDTRWSHPLTLNPNHRTKYTQQFEERVDWTWEAYGLSPAMKAKYPGKGSTYLASYRDSAGDWFDGSKNYKFTIAADAPAARFWDVSTYNLETRAMLQNGDHQNAVNTFTKGLVTNDDGTIDIFFGPEEPKGKGANWVKTQAGDTWFTYFRLYGPTEAYFDRSWPMYDIKMIK